MHHLRRHPSALPPYKMKRHQNRSSGPPPPPFLPATTCLPRYSAHALALLRMETPPICCRNLKKGECSKLRPRWGGWITQEEKKRKEKKENNIKEETEEARPQTPPPTPKILTKQLSSVGRDRGSPLSPETALSSSRWFVPFSRSLPEKSVCSSLKSLASRDPDVRAGQLLYDSFDLVVDLLEAVAFYDGWGRKREK